MALDQNDPGLEEGDDCVSESESFYAGDISELIVEYSTPPQPIPPTQSDSGSSKKSTSSSDFSANLGKRKTSALSASSNDFSEAPLSKKPKPNPVSISEHTTLASSPVLIVHCPTVQRLFEKMKICRGVQYELARLVSSERLSYNDITPDKLKKLVGCNKISAPQVEEVFYSKSTAQPTNSAFAREIASKSPWEELDREEAALANGPYEGLGNNPNQPDWYGGKVEFRGRLSQQDGNVGYKITLESCCLGASSRFTRRFGSWSFLRVKIPTQIFFSHNDLERFFQRSFVIWGKVFRACYAKDDNVFFYWTNEIYPMGKPLLNRMSFHDFIMWHNPLQQNSNQLMTKWAARLPLGFSNSLPGPRLLQENILPEEDVVSSKKSDMTDGCGLTTQSVHRSIWYQLSLPLMPTAFQFRLAGSKGMSIFRDEISLSDSAMRGWFRPSQTKIRYPPGLQLDPAMLTFDLLRTSHMRSPSRLSTETIINLAENGVPHSRFVDLLKATLREMVKGLTTWDGLMRCSTSGSISSVSVVS
ncbi:unnamed protein product [Cyclocybe aegerita]|uniref:RNA-dependent RNA polymerase n=1 Tax=Cyclocybe aegerita TaxID=1973307 RepID=A0A8S0WTL9_CYCAE|nr:unnamed protein product [Cyclocybe aegerita]